MYEPKTFINLSDKDWKNIEKYQELYKKIFTQMLYMNGYIVKMDEKELFDAMCTNIHKYDKRAFSNYVDLVKYTKLICTIEKTWFGRLYLRHVTKKLKKKL